MKLVLPQINPTVGDLKGNCERIISAYERPRGRRAELVLTPELAITDILRRIWFFKSRFVPENLLCWKSLHAHVGKSALLVGFVDRNEGRGNHFTMLPLYSNAAHRYGRRISRSCRLTMFLMRTAISSRPACVVAI